MSAKAQSESLVNEAKRWQLPFVPGANAWARENISGLKTPCEGHAILACSTIILWHDHWPALRPIARFFFFAATGIGTLTMVRMIDVATDAVTHRAANQNV